MASKYWIKLYHEILDDPKMGRLTDRLFKRTIQLFLLAGDYDADGYLPSVEDMSWRLRIPAEDLETDLADLASTGIVQMKNDRWLVTKFEDRQAASTGTERWKRWKERQTKKNYYQTPRKRNANDTLSDIDKDKEPDKEKEEEKIGGAGFYIFNLVGFDYDDCDSGTKKKINQLIYKYGEEQLCDIADFVYEVYPGVGLRQFLGKIEERANGFGSIHIRKENETVTETYY